MSMIYDNWERLVAAVLDREHLRQLSRDDSSVYSIGTSSDSRFSSPLNDVVSLDIPVPGPGPHDARSSSLSAQSASGNTTLLKKVVFKVDVKDDRDKKKVMKAVSSFSGVDSVSMDMMLRKLTIVGDIDPVRVTQKLRKSHHTEILSVGPAK
ncbi:hypothetical protein PHJA_000249700 [Phtheirospermum japonicum]|uniref:HMA domain-containing protein n=1 Tax=Phtheirospermum japonicum TaxID=374723 RepID=A0A830B8M9_9LAMI|nr:hypothetical protein PHJA_000249700 [Phtheirospermum japonicum]